MYYYSYWNVYSRHEKTKPEQQAISTHDALIEYLEYYRLQPTIDAVSRKKIEELGKIKVTTLAEVTKKNHGMITLARTLTQNYPHQRVHGHTLQFLAETSAKCLFTRAENAVFHTELDPSLQASTIRRVTGATREIIFWESSKNPAQRDAERKHKHTFWNESDGNTVGFTVGSPSPVTKRPRIITTAHTPTRLFAPPTPQIIVMPPEQAAVTTANPLTPK